MELLDILKWFASISGIIAAFMVSLDNGRRVTGWGFALFVASSIAWISGALIDGDRLEELVDIARDADVWILSDEVFLFTSLSFSFLTSSFSYFYL